MNTSFQISVKATDSKFFHNAGFNLDFFTVLFIMSWWCHSIIHETLARIWPSHLTDSFSWFLQFIHPHPFPMYLFEPPFPNWTVILISRRNYTQVAAGKLQIPVRDSSSDRECSASDGSPRLWQLGWEPLVSSLNSPSRTSLPSHLVFFLGGGGWKKYCKYYIL